MRTGEHHPQLVIADGMRRRSPLGADVVQHGGQFLSRTKGFTANAVERPVARDPHQPGAGVVGHAVPRPDIQRFYARFLDGVFGDRQIAAPARQRGDRRAPVSAEDAVQCAHLAYRPEIPASRRTSTVDAGIIEASFTASSRSVAAST